MSCFVLGCDERVVIVPTSVPNVEAPAEFKHPRFGRVQACQGHGATLVAMDALYEIAQGMAEQTLERYGVVIVRCVQCGKGRGRCECPGYMEARG